MTITIRRPRPDEAKALTELILRSKRSNGYDEAFMSACVPELTVTTRRLAENEFWLAEANGRLCGCACLAAGAAEGIGQVLAFFVAPGLQRRGIGRALWGRLVERARARNIGRLELDADPFAVPFYQAMGMRTVGAVPSGSIAGRTLPRMAIQLGR